MDTPGTDNEPLTREQVERMTQALREASAAIRKMTAEMEADSPPRRFPRLFERDGGPFGFLARTLLSAIWWIIIAAICIVIVRDMLK